MSTTQSFATSHAAGHVIGGGRYSLHVTLGESGHVWLAQDEVEQRLVVIRFFPPELRADARGWELLKQRFSPLLSQNLAGVSRALDWYEADGVEPFVAFEYVEGQTVAPRNASMPWQKLKPLACDVAAAMRALHSCGIVHHGIEPGNIIITEAGAKLINPVVTGVLKNPLLTPSALQNALELRWASPQQISGGEPGVADDFYGFGVTLFEMLTGAPLFASARTMLSDIRQGAPDIGSRLCAIRSIPSEVQHFIALCLASDAAQRPTETPAFLQSTEEIAVAPTAVVEASKQVVSLEPADSVPEMAVLKTARSAVSRRSKAPIIAGLLALGILAGGGAWYVSQSRAEQQRLAAANEEKTRETDRLRQLADEQRRHAALLEEKKQQESEGRRRAETELKRREVEAAQVAKAEEERRAIHASVQVTPAALATKAASAEPLRPSADEDGFASLFNGRDLSGWQGDSKLWSVVEGCITGQLPANAPTHQRHYLLSESGSVEDFELRFSYRFRLLKGNRQPNAGVVYRATTNSSPELSAYQFDVVTDAKNIGAVNDDKKRYRICGFGESGVAGANEKTQVIAQLGNTNKISAVQPEDWNSGVIIARGNHLSHYINGELAADVIDEHARRMHKKGMLALELHARNTNNPAMFVQFRDLKVKRLPASRGMLSAAR